jgi:TetR/AcrR family transcriptional regulator, lmrAB and yxaGH operons repressor
MADEVAAFVGRTFAVDILAPVQDDDLPVQARIDAIARNLRDFYGKGTKACLVDVLSIVHISDRTSQCLAMAATAWIEAFASLGRQAGLDRRTARQRGEDAVASIEGALVLARATGSTKAFDRALRRLATALTTP